MPIRLQKDIDYTFTPADPGEPGFAGQPALPARTALVNVTVCGYWAYTPAELAVVYASRGVRYEFIDGAWRLFTPPGVSLPLNYYACRQQQQYVFVPAQPYLPPRAPRPAAPAQLVRDFNLGWNSRARSINPLPADGYFSFTIPHTVVGVVCGFSPAPERTGFADITHGFRMSDGGVLTVVENGVLAFSVGVETAPANLAVQRIGGVVTYLQDDVVVYTSARSAPSGPLYLSAAMYSGGDLVDDAELTIPAAAGGGAAFMRGMQAIGSDEDGYAGGEATMHPARASGSRVNRGSGEAFLHGLQAIGADAVGYAVGEAFLHGLEADGEGIEELDIAIGVGTLLPMQGVGLGVSGTFGGGAAFLHGMQAIGSDENGYAQGHAFLHPMRATGENFTPINEGLVLSTVLSVDAFDRQSVTALVMNSFGEITGLLAIQPVALADVNGVAQAASSLMPATELAALLVSSSAVAVELDDPATSGTTWVLHLDVAGSTRYSNFNFNSFAKVGTRHYGANADGLFELSGDDDNGEEIVSEINFGNLRFGSSVRKSMRYCYVGVASNGRLVLKVEADGETYYYDVRDYDELHEMQRFELGRGLRAVYYNFTLQNYGGSAFDLASIEFTPIPLTRRL